MQIDSFPSDAEHPSLIPMDVPTSLSTPLGPMTRARAKPIEDKVNSLLSELPLTTHETWLLPHLKTMCNQVHGGAPRINYLQEPRR